MREFACTKEASDTVFAARQAMHRILHGMDDRMIVVIGPARSTIRAPPSSTPSA